MSDLLSAQIAAALGNSSLPLRSTPESSILYADDSRESGSRSENEIIPVLNLSVETTRRLMASFTEYTLGIIKIHFLSDCKAQTAVQYRLV